MLHVMLKEMQEIKVGTLQKLSIKPPNAQRSYFLRFQFVGYRDKANSSHVGPKPMGECPPCGVGSS